ncbi:MarR family winged helix-turn-helix transcriptional regulator [Stigmatella erecta]|uniref:DNA-binding transcriptional regulator, MarR family n=1 Tax=Stigmatella erecta TaxID=83460 RepID=A0A1H9ZBD5_9BACT|nr:MarR family transcriptional regulator [Stigmatella erecta]SES78773.1 DNA-binding transcriptional regulator, MarR family [Stigmatella erecta]
MIETPLSPEQASAPDQSSAPELPAHLRDMGSRLHEMLMRAGRARSMLRDPISLLCENLQLSSPQFHVILWLGYEGPLHIGVLARRAAIHDKSITGVVDRLEKMDFVERTRSPEDRRSVSIQLTAEGQKLYAQVTTLIETGLGNLLGMLEPHYQTALFDIVERLIQGMSAKQNGCAPQPVDT